MDHRPRPRSFWTVAIVFSLIAGLFAAISATPAGAQAAAPVIVQPQAQAADIGHRACMQLRATGAGPITWEAVGSLPPGLSLDREGPSAGRLGGRPEQTGDYTIQVRATNAGGTSAPVSFLYRVFTPNPSVPVIKAGRYSQGFTIDCFSAGWSANEFLSNPANFGPSATVRLASGLPIHEQTADDRTDTRFITPAYLADADILFDGFVTDRYLGGTRFESEYTKRELRLIRRWVNDGGVLIAAEDDENSDRLGELFGAPTLAHELPPRGSEQYHCGDAGEPSCPQFTPVRSARNHPIVAGPFGTWTRITSAGTVGYLAEGFDRSWTRVANHPNGNASIIERKVGNGHVIVLTDEGLLRTNLTGDNGTFVGNLFAFAIAQVSDVPAATNDVFSGRLFRRFNANVCRNDDRGDGGVRVRITGGELPPGLRLNGRTCKITGTPRLDAFGTFGATYSITDRDGDTDSARIQITLNGDFGGADTNPRCLGRRATIVGTRGADVIRGTSGPDVIVAGGGKDVIRGLGGNDLICGGRGADIIDAGSGTDRCSSGPGRDRVRGCESGR